VVAVLLVVTSISVAGLLPVIVVVAAAALWTPQARAWFDGRVYERPVPPPSVQATITPYQSGEAGQPTGPTSTRTSPVDSTWAPPTGSGQASSTTLRGRRPGVVTAALAVTWSCCGLVALGLVLVMARGLVDKDGLFAQVARSGAGSRLGTTPNAVLAELLVTCVLLLLWTLVVAGMAVPAALGAGWARMAIVVNAVAVAVFSVALTFAVPPAGLLLLVASVSVAVLLLLPASNAWYAGRRPAPRAPAPRPGGKPPVW
jgi:hypothetical protein